MRFSKQHVIDWLIRLIARVAARSGVNLRAVVTQVALTFLAIAPIGVVIWLGLDVQVSGLWLLAFALVAVAHLEYRGFMIFDQPLGSAPWQWLADRGLIELLFVVIVVGIALGLRTASGWRLGVFLFFYVGYWVLVTLFLYRRRGQAATIVKSLAALMLGPVLWSWFAISVIAGLVAVVPWVVTVACTRLGADASDTHVVKERQADPASGTVAVTLSGGGYRAALIHAGVLSVLDQAQIPIRVLSTVSGGSIVGANYAIGHSPDRFRAMLAADRPGLPNDLLNFVQFMGTLTFPLWTNADSYEFHFDRKYFHGETLRNTGGPTLVLNATDYASGRRVAFWPATASGVRLAHLVAASAAFPVAFDPVHDAGGRYVDGGIVENLGVDGLREYLAREKDAPTPTVLLISDASAEPGRPADTVKAGLLDASSKALEAQFVSLHERIYEFYTAEDPSHRYDRNSTQPLRQPYRTAAARLWPGRDGAVAIFILSPTSPAERARFAARPKIIEGVARLSTLRELSPREVDAAFWAGASLAVAYLDQLCVAAGMKRSCSVSPPAPPAGFD